MLKLKECKNCSPSSRFDKHPIEMMGCGCVLDVSRSAVCGKQWILFHRDRSIHVKQQCSKELPPDVMVFLFPVRLVFCFPND
jgi:hypothetical protein